MLLALLVNTHETLANDLTITCTDDIDACLTSFESKQAQHEVNTPMWWEFQLQKLDVLFNFQRNDELYATLRPWLNNRTILADVKPPILLYWGKWLRVNHRQDEAEKALRESLAGFKSQFSKAPSPQLGIRILNLLSVLGMNKEAERFALKLETKKYDAPMFYREVFAELGHIALREGDNKKHIDYRIKSLTWAKQVPDLQQQAIAYYGYAVALRNNKDYKQAEVAFIEGLACAEQAQDFAQVNNIKMRIADLALLRAQPEKARTWFRRVSVNDLPSVVVKDYRALAKRISTSN